MPADFGQDIDRGANRPLRRVLEGARKAEIGQHAVAHEFGDEAAEPSDRAGHGVLIAADQRAQKLGIDRAGQRRGADHVAEQHRDLAPFGFARRIGGGRRGRLERRARRAPCANAADCPWRRQAVRDRARSAPARCRGRYRSPRKFRHIARTCDRATSREAHSWRHLFGLPFRVRTAPIPHPLRPPVPTCHSPRKLGICLSVTLRWPRSGPRRATARAHRSYPSRRAPQDDGSQDECLVTGLRSIRVGRSRISSISTRTPARFRSAKFPRRRMILRGLSCKASRR